MSRIFLLLFAGGMNQIYNYPRYREDLEYALEAFRGLEGFSVDKTFFLHGAGGSTVAVDHRQISTEPGTRDRLKATLSKIANEATADDTFWMVVSNHGGWTIRNTRNAKLHCWNEEVVTDSELALWCDQLPCDAQLFILGQCKSGGFIDNLESPKRVIMTASRWDQNSWATADLKYDEFLFHFFSAILGQAATPKDAYDYAVAHDGRPEEPQYSDPTSIATRKDLLQYIARS